MLLIRYSLWQWYCGGCCCEGTGVQGHTTCQRGYDASHDGEGPLSGGDSNFVTVV